MSWVHRITAAAGLLSVVAAGVFWVAAKTDTSAQKTRTLLAREVPAEDARARAMARNHNSAGSRSYFDAELQADLEAFSLAPMSIDILAEPNRFSLPITKRRSLTIGGELRGDHVRIEVVEKKISAQSQGISVNRLHSLVVARNVGDVPIAYFLDVKATGDDACDGSRRHNAMALRPGESAEVLACPGRRQFHVSELRVLELTPIGHVYVSQLPPEIVGYPAFVSRAHTGGSGVQPCTQLPAAQLNSRIRSGELQWEDIVDFFSRHSCARHSFVPGYRRATATLSQLPVNGENE